MLAVCYAPSDNQMQQSATVRNPLSAVNGVINNNNNKVPFLDSEMAAIVTLKVAERRRLTNNNCGDAINKFTEKKNAFYSAFSFYVENRAKAYNRSFLLQLLDKLERGVITQQQYKGLKACDEALLLLAIIFRDEVLPILSKASHT
jgi:hypothetical protein